MRKPRDRKFRATVPLKATERLNILSYSFKFETALPKILTNCLHFQTLCSPLDGNLVTKKRFNKSRDTIPLKLTRPSVYNGLSLSLRITAVSFAPKLVVVTSVLSGIQQTDVLTVCDRFEDITLHCRSPVYCIPTSIVHTINSLVNIARYVKKLELFKIMHELTVVGCEMYKLSVGNMS